MGVHVAAWVASITAGWCAAQRNDRGTHGPVNYCLYFITEKAQIINIYQILNRISILNSHGKSRALFNGLVHHIVVL